MKSEGISRVLHTPTYRVYLHSVVHTVRSAQCAVEVQCRQSVSDGAVCTVPVYSLLYQTVLNRIRPSVIYQPPLFPRTLPIIRKYRWPLQDCHFRYVTFSPPFEPNQKKRFHSVCSRQRNPFRFHLNSPQSPISNFHFPVSSSPLNPV